MLYFDSKTWSLNESHGTPVSLLTGCCITLGMGLLFALFLPAIGFVMLAKALWASHTDGP